MCQSILANFSQKITDQTFPYQDYGIRLRQLHNLGETSKGRCTSGFAEADGDVHRSPQTPMANQFGLNTPPPTPMKSKKAARHDPFTPRFKVIRESLWRRTTFPLIEWWIIPESCYVQQ
jgi:hypothetical protein